MHQFKHAKNLDISYQTTPQSTRSTQGPENIHEAAIIITDRCEDDNKKSIRVFPKKTRRAEILYGPAGSASETGNDQT